MNVFSWNELRGGPRAIQRPVSLTIGVFDGLHIGHRKLLDGITGSGALPLVITFRESPLLLRAPSLFPGLILTWRQRLERLESLGVSTVVAIDFSKELSNLSGKAFIRLLTENLTIQRIVVGQNFRFGKNRDSGTGDLKEMLSDTGIEVHVMEPVIWDEGIVSSSRIRAAIINADFTSARAMLASDYSIDLRDAARGEAAAGHLRIPRGDLAQVLPREGSFPVACVGAAGRRTGRLTIDPDFLTIEAGDCSDIISIHIMETGERSTAHASHEGS
jgi:riboflavin kinase/FMN adenylyltransferase